MRRKPQSKTSERSRKMLETHQRKKKKTKEPHSPSSSKWVSVPSSSSTEQTILALRKVVHLFTRLRCPPMSFCRRQLLSNATHHNRTDSFTGREALTGHTLATMVWMFLVFPLLSVSRSRKKKYSLASLGSLPSGIRWASMKIGSERERGEAISSER